MPAAKRVEYGRKAIIGRDSERLVNFFNDVRRQKVREVGADELPYLVKLFEMLHDRRGHEPARLRSFLQTLRISHRLQGLCQPPGHSISLLFLISCFVSYSSFRSFMRKWRSFCDKRSSHRFYKLLLHSDYFCLGHRTERLTRRRGGGAKVLVLLQNLGVHLERALIYAREIYS